MPHTAMAPERAPDIRFPVVQSASDINDAKVLLHAFCHVIIHEHHFDDDGILDDIANDLADYRQPRSVFVLARVNGQAAGCLAVRPFTDEIGEIKRMYVAPEFRGLQLGRLLIEEIERHARSFGYTELYLSSLYTFTHAHKLYAACGYEKIPAYCDYPIEMAASFGKRL